MSANADNRCVGDLPFSILSPSLRRRREMLVVFIRIDTFTPKISAICGQPALCWREEFSECKIPYSYCCSPRLRITATGRSSNVKMPIGLPIHRNARPVFTNEFAFTKQQKKLTMALQHFQQLGLVRRDEVKTVKRIFHRMHLSTIAAAALRSIQARMEVHNIFYPCENLRIASPREFSRAEFFPVPSPV